MKFSILKETFLDELQLLQGIVEKRNTMPILANILMNVGDGEVELTGTDLEVGLQDALEAEIEEPGAITVIGQEDLRDRQVPARRARRSTFEEGRDLMMEITAGESEFKVLCLPKEDYPQVPDAKFEQQHRPARSTDFKEMIDRVFFAIAQEQRYYLNGALLVLKNRVDRARQHGRPPAVLYDEGRGRPEARPRRSEVIVAKKTLERAAEIRARRRSSSTWTRTTSSSGSGPDAHLPDHREQIPQFRGGHPQGQPDTAGHASGASFADAIRRVSLLSAERSRGDQVHRRKEPAAALLLEPGDRRGPRQAGRRIQGRRTSRSASTPSTCSIS